MKNKNLAIIPIREGSKRIKDKNIKNFNGKPLFYYSLKAAINSGVIDKIIITSDSLRYLKLVKKYFKTSNLIEYLIRPYSISRSTSSTESAISHCLKNYKDFENIFLIQATSPLIASEDLVLGFKKYKKFNYDSLFSAYLSKSFLWKLNENANLRSINYDYKKRPMSQVFKNYLILENGSFYIFKYKKFTKYNNRLFDKIGFYEMNKYLSIDIDDIKDFKLAEFISSNIKLFKN